MSCVFSQCGECINYDVQGSKDNQIPSCKAFPSGIPKEVFFNEVSHTNNIDGDHGIKFEPED